MYVGHLQSCRLYFASQAPAGSVYRPTRATGCGAPSEAKMMTDTPTSITWAMFVKPRLFTGDAFVVPVTCCRGCSYDQADSTDCIRSD